MRVRAVGRTIDCGIATTRHERAAVVAQRFRVYQRRGYHRPGLQVDRDAHDRRAVYFMALLGDGGTASWLLGSARLVLGESRRGFQFPAEGAFEFELPSAFREIPVDQRAEVSRLVTEPVQGVLIGGLLTPLGLIQALTLHAQRQGIRLGLSIMKARLLRVLHGAGLPFHELTPARVTYPTDGPMAGYFFSNPDPAIPVCWLADEIAPAVGWAIDRYGTGSGKP